MHRLTVVAMEEFLKHIVLTPFLARTNSFDQLFENCTV